MCNWKQKGMGLDSAYCELYECQTKEFRLCPIGSEHPLAYNIGSGDGETDTRYLEAELPCLSNQLDDGNEVGG